MGYTFNVFTGNFDYFEDDVQVVPTAPITGQEGILYQAEDDPTKNYYFIDGHRYVLEATLDDPVSAGGPWLSLGFTNFDT